MKIGTSYLSYHIVYIVPITGFSTSSLSPYYSTVTRRGMISASRSARAKSCLQHQAQDILGGEGNNPLPEGSGARIDQGCLTSERAAFLQFLWRSPSEGLKR